MGTAPAPLPPGRCFPILRGEGARLSGLAQHLVDLVAILQFRDDHLAGVFLQSHVLVPHKSQQFVINAQSSAFVLSGIALVGATGVLPPFLQAQSRASRGSQSGGTCCPSPRGATVRVMELAQPSVCLFCDLSALCGDASIESGQALL